MHIVLVFTLSPIDDQHAQNAKKKVTSSSFRQFDVGVQADGNERARFRVASAAFAPDPVPAPVAAAAAPVRPVAASPLPARPVFSPSPLPDHPLLPATAKQAFTVVPPTRNFQ